MIERERLSIITSAGNVPKGILLNIENMSISALIELADHQLQGNDEREIFLYNNLGEAKPMDMEALELARNLSKAGRHPIELLKGLAEKMKEHSHIAIVDPSIFTSS